METRANYALVGAFVLSMLTIVVVAFLWVARIEFNQPFNYYDVYLTGSVTGLSDGSVVRYNGIPVGRVKDIQLDPQNQEQVRVTMEINANTVIKSDAVATLEIQGLTGSAFMEIAGGSAEAPPLERREGQRYPVIAFRQSGLQRVVTSAPEVLARLINVADRLAEILDDRNRAAIAETLDNMRRLSAVAAGRAGEVDAAIGDGAAAVRDLRGTLANANQTLAELRQFLAQGGDAQAALKAVQETTRKLGDTATHVDALVQETRPPVREFGQRGLNEFTQLLVDARGLVAELNRLAEAIERNPSQLLYGDRRQGYQPR